MVMGRRRGTAGRPIWVWPISRFAEQNKSVVFFCKMPKWKGREGQYMGVPWREHPYFRFNPDPSLHLQGIRIMEARRREVRAYISLLYLKLRIS